jgi:hypothetical protein
MHTQTIGGHSSERANGHAAPGGFVPTHSWRDVPEGAVLPPGLMVKMNVQTGINRARLAPGDELCPVCGLPGKLAIHDGGVMCARCANGRA